MSVCVFVPQTITNVPCAFAAVFIIIAFLTFQRVHFGARTILTTRAASLAEWHGPELGANI